MLDRNNPYESTSAALYKTIEILGPTTNIVSCLILSLVISHIYRISRQVEVGRDTITANNKVDVFVICSHIGITVAYTVSQFVTLFYKNMDQNYRMQTAFLFFGGMADIFLSVMLWFILDADQSATIVETSGRTYLVTSVIKYNSSTINIDCVEDEALDEPMSSYDSYSFTSVSKRMID